MWKQRHSTFCVSLPNPLILYHCRFILKSIVRPFSLHGYFSNSSLSHFPQKILVQDMSNSSAKPRKLFAGSSVALACSGFSHSATCHAFDELSDRETIQSSKENTPRRDCFDFLYLMEEQGLYPDCNTFMWLLEVCLNSRSLRDAKRVHSKILKLGFEGESDLSVRMIDIYLHFGSIDDAICLFVNMYHRSVVSWNTIMNALLANKLNWKVLEFFSRIVGEGCPAPDSVTFLCALRAFSHCKAPFHYVEQIHAKIFRYGCASDSIVGNPLIDLYSKSGNIDSAQAVFEELSSKDSVTWVAMISGISQNGREEEAHHLFSQMKRSGVKPTPYVFSSVLSACTKSKYFYLGKQLHAEALKNGFMSQTFVGNALITLYSRCGNLISAEQIFHEMPAYDAVTYNSLICAHSQCGKSERALHVFQEMQISSFMPDAVTIASLLSACATLGALDKGKQLHSHVVKSGIFSDIIIEGSLLDLYVKCDDIATAREFFNTTNKENVVLWNVMLVAYGQKGNLRESFELFCQMQVAGMKPNQHTYPSILRTCTSLGALDLGEQIHTLAVKTGFDLNVYVSSVLIDMYSKCGRLNTARGILERLREKDVVSWTAMIAGYAQHDLFIEALRLFAEMQTCGVRSDNIGFSSALSACAGIQALKQGLQIHAQAFVSGYSEDLSIGNSLVTLYARCGRVNDAYLAFKRVKNKDVITWNSLISGLAQSGHYGEALDVFAEMNRASVTANVFTFGPALSAAANIAYIKHGKQIHARIIKTSHDLEIEVANALITLYAKCGVLRDAEREFFEMSERNEFSWNSMITGYSQHGSGRKALELFEEMKQKGYKPNHVTFVGVLSACSHVGLVLEGLSYFNSMSEEHGIVPKPEHYACVVDILGRSGLLDRAREFIEQMPMHPDAMIWRTLLSACTVHKNIEIGEFAAKHLLELEPQDSATYVLLSNIYAIARKWDLRDRMRQMMKDRGVKKEPGRSWLEFKNSVHAFFVGDRLHPLADKIYEKIEELNKTVGEIGYVPDPYSLLHDIEQDQRDPSLFIHSEKLAVAFGLIKMSPDIPIRVIKNLRVCNDCHNWMKFVSRVANRTVIVRDTYRFHHFEGGICSCGDYW